MKADDARELTALAREATWLRIERKTMARLTEEVMVAALHGRLELVPRLDEVEQRCSGFIKEAFEAAGYVVGASLLHAFIIQWDSALRARVVCETTREGVSA